MDQTFSVYKHQATSDVLQTHSPSEFSVTSSHAEFIFNGGDRRRCSFEHGHSSFCHLHPNLFPHRPLLPLSHLSCVSEKVHLERPLFQLLHGKDRRSGLAYCRCQESDKQIPKYRCTDSGSCRRGTPVCCQLANVPTILWSTSPSPRCDSRTLDNRERYCNTPYSSDGNHHSHPILPYTRPSHPVYRPYNPPGRVLYFYHPSLHSHPCCLHRPGIEDGITRRPQWS